jgi:tetratricopeptide (TPR) repeat protein
MTSNSVQQASILLDKASKAAELGKHEEVTTLLLPLVRCKNKTLSPSMKRDVFLYISRSFDMLYEYDSALIYMKKYQALTGKLFGIDSIEYVDSSYAVANIYMNMKMHISARTYATEGIAILEKCQFQKHRLYGNLHTLVGDIDREVKLFKEALVSYEKAETCFAADEVLRKNIEYGTVLNNMAICHQQLGDWNEALATYKIAAEQLSDAVPNMLINERRRISPQHLYAITLNNIALIYSEIKQYELAVPLFEKVYEIYKKLYGKEMGLTVAAKTNLDFVRFNMLKVRRDLIKVKYNYGMCNFCKKIKEDMDQCLGCCKVWYCNAECQLKHWEEHKPNCSVCSYCDTVVERPVIIQFCSKCKKAKYCNAECQKNHWSEHKKICCSNLK